VRATWTRADSVWLACAVAYALLVLVSVIWKLVS